MAGPPPRSGWSCWDGQQWTEDPTLSLQPGQLQECGTITISATGEATIQSTHLGVYTQTEEQYFQVCKNINV